MYSEKVRRVLAYKRLDWTDIEVPPLPPKENFIPLTGGYRRMPVLQIGADIYCDSALILDVLERISPNPTIYPTADGGVATMIADWADHRVARWAIMAVFPDYLQHVPEAFIKDRAALIPDLAPDRLKVLAPHAFDQFGQFVRIIDQALASRRFVAGDAFSVADAACYHVLAFAKNSARVFAPAANCPRIIDWMQRIAAFPSPKVEVKSNLYPLEVARSHTPSDVGSFSPANDTFALGESVTIAADDYATEQIRGEIVKLSSNEIAVRQISERLGEIAIHFPRLGFSISANTSR
jgi:glutathione S-transferase